MRYGRVCVCARMSRVIQQNYEPKIIQNLLCTHQYPFNVIAYTLELLSIILCGVPRIVRHGDARSRTVDNKKNVQRINIFMEQIGQIPKRQAAPSKRIQHIRCL